MFQEIELRGMLQNLLTDTSLKKGFTKNQLLYLRVYVIDLLATNDFSIFNIDDLTKAQNILYKGISPQTQDIDRFLVYSNEQWFTYCKNYNNANSDTSEQIFLMKEQLHNKRTLEKLESKSPNGDMDDHYSMLVRRKEYSEFINKRLEQNEKYLPKGATARQYALVFYYLNESKRLNGWNTDISKRAKFIAFLSGLTKGNVEKKLLDPFRYNGTSDRTVTELLKDLNKVREFFEVVEDLKVTDLIDAKIKEIENDLND